MLTPIKHGGKPFGQEGQETTVVGCTDGPTKDRFAPNINKSSLTPVLTQF